MQIKSWQIALLALILPLITFFQDVFCTKFCKNETELRTTEIFIGSVVIFALIPMLLMMISATKKIGALISIILGAFYVSILILISFLALNDNPSLNLLSYFLIISPGIFLLAAGINYLLKKV